MVRLTFLTKINLGPLLAARTAADEEVFTCLSFEVNLCLPSIRFVITGRTAGRGSERGGVFCGSDGRNIVMLAGL